MNRRVVFLITRLTRGGAEKQLTRVAVSLKTRGWDLTVVSMGEPLAFQEELEATGIRVVSLGISHPVKGLGGLVRLVSCLKDWRPDALVTMLPHANILGRLAGRLAKVPVVVSSIRNEAFGGRFRWMLEKHSSVLSDRVVFNSGMVAKNLLDRGLCRKDQVTVIPNGIEFRQSRNEAHESSVWMNDDENSHNGFVWVSVSHLYPKKDHRNLLRAAHHLDREGEDFTLILAGDGPLRKDLEDFTSELGIGDKVRFLGMRGDVPLLLGRCDGFVLPSAWEGMPNALMEAMALGIPVVSTKVGGVPELVDHGVTGWLVPPNNPEQLAHQMAQVMSMEQDVRQRVASAGRDRVLEEYDMEVIVDRWEQLLLELIDRSPRNIDRMVAS